MQAANDTSMVDDMGNLGAVCDQLDLASESREALGGRLLGLRRGNHDLRDAGVSEMSKTLSDVLAELSPEQLTRIIERCYELRAKPTFGEQLIQSAKEAREIASTLCQCGKPLVELDLGHEIVTACCRRAISSCCEGGDY